MMWKKVIWLNFIDPALGKYNSQNNNNSALYWSHNGETYGVSLLQTSQAATRGAIGNMWFIWESNPAQPVCKAGVLITTLWNHKHHKKTRTQNLNKWQLVVVEVSNVRNNYNKVKKKIMLI